MYIPTYGKNPEIAKENRFKVGDTVKIRCKKEMEFLCKKDENSKNAEERGTTAYLIRDMIEYSGQIKTVKKVREYKNGEVLYKLNGIETWEWDNYMFEPNKNGEKEKEEIPSAFNSPELIKKSLFMVGEVVTICSKEELALLNENNGRSWYWYEKTGYSRGSAYYINDEMLSKQGKKAKILEVQRGTHYFNGKEYPEITYRIDVDGKSWCWTCYMFEETRRFYKAKKESEKNERYQKRKAKRKNIKKQVEKRVEIPRVEVEPFVTENIFAYDYENGKKKIDIPKRKAIMKIEVTVITGDETGLIFFSDGSTMQFDSCDCRTSNYFDGSYTITADNAEKWINFVPNVFNAENFARQRMKFAATLL